MTLGAKEREINFEEAVWTVPASRMKNKKEFRIPLSDRALAILRDLLRVAGNEHVFPGTIMGRGMDAGRMLDVLKSMNWRVTTHGFRNSFGDWAVENGYPDNLAKLALSHTIGSKEVDQAYFRTDRLSPRRKMMDAWAKYCESPPAAVASIATAARETRAG
jgi:integrase